MMVEMLVKAQKYVNVEDTLAAIRDEEKPRRGKERKKIGGDEKEKGEIVRASTEKVKGL